MYVERKKQQQQPEIQLSMKMCCEKTSALNYFNQSIKNNE